MFEFYCLNSEVSAYQSTVLHKVSHLKIHFHWAKADSVPMLSAMKKELSLILGGKK